MLQLISVEDHVLQDVVDKFGDEDHVGIFVLWL